MSLKSWKRSPHPSHVTEELEKRSPQTCHRRVGKRSPQSCLPVLNMTQLSALVVIDWRWHKERKKSKNCMQYYKFCPKPCERNKTLLNQKTSRCKTSDTAQTISCQCSKYTDSIPLICSANEFFLFLFKSIIMYYTWNGRRRQRLHVTAEPRARKTAWSHQRTGRRCSGRLTAVRLRGACSRGSNHSARVPC